MTYLQLLFVALSSCAGAILALSAWRGIQAVRTLSPAGVLRLKPRQRTAPASPARAPRAEDRPPKPRGAEVSPETELVLRAVKGVQAAVADLAKAQIDLLNASDAPPPAPDLSRLETLIKRLPAHMRKDQKPPLDQAELEGKIDQIVARHQREAGRDLTQRLDKLTAGVEAVFTKLGAKPAAPPSADDIAAALRPALTEMEGSLAAASRSVETRLGDANRDLVTGLSQHLSGPSPQLDRIEVLLTRLLAAAPEQVSEPVGDPASKLAALTGYRRSGLAEEAEHPAPVSTAQSSVVKAVREPDAASPDEADRLTARLTQSEQRLLKTHPGLASILLKKQRAQGA